MTQEFSITDAASKVLKVLLERRAVAGKPIRISDLLTATGLSYSEFDSADTYLLGARYIEGTGGGPDGFRSITPRGIERVSVAKKTVVREDRPMPTLKERIENNLVIFFLGTLLAGFIAGISTYAGILTVVGDTRISTDRLRNLEDELGKRKDKLSQVEQELKATDETLTNVSTELASTKRELQETRGNTVSQKEYEQLKQNVTLAKDGEKSRAATESKLKEATRRADMLLAENQRLAKKINADITGEIAKLEEQQNNLEREINFDVNNFQEFRATASNQLQACEVCKADSKCPSNFKLAYCTAGASYEAKAAALFQKIEWNKNRLGLVTGEITKLRSALDISVHTSSSK